MAPQAAAGAVGTALQVQLSMRDIAWLAGLLEGEGAFTMSGGGIAVELNMTDRDVVDAAARLVGATSVNRNNNHETRNHKPCYRWTLCGNKAAGWMMTIYSLMGTRRRGRIRELLAKWRAMKPRYRNAVHCEHRDRPSYGRGLCQTCHAKAWYERNKDKVLASNRARYWLNHERYRAQHAAYRASKKGEAAG
jgi:hypothetical protein